MLKKNLFYVLAICIVIIVATYFFINSNNLDTEPIVTKNNNVVTEIKTEKFYFQGGEYSLVLQTQQNGEQILSMKKKDDDIKEIGLEDVKGLGSIDVRYSSFLWANDKTRLYFISTINKLNNVAILYIDITDPDPYAITEIVFDDPDHIFDEFAELTSAEGQIIYMTIDNKKYKLDFSNGVSSKLELIEDANNIIVSDSWQAISSNIYDYQISMTVGLKL